MKPFRMKIKHEVRNPQQGKTKQRRRHALRTNRMKISYKNVIDISDLKTYQQTMNMKWKPQPQEQRKQKLHQN